MQKIIYIFIMTLFFNSWIYGSEGAKIKTFFLTTTEIGSLEDNLAKYQLTKKEIQSIKKWNSQVSNFLQIPIGTKLYIEIPYENFQKAQEHKQPSLPPKKLTAKLNKPKKKIQKTKKKGHKISVFYTYSKGDFTQKLNSYKVETSQNSPITLGLSYNHELNRKLKISSSAYYSQLKAVETFESGNKTRSLRAPYEYGLTTYLEWYNPFNAIPVTPYTGFDFESFDAYNIEEIIESSVSAEFERQNLFYGTLGIASTSKWINHPLLVKLSTSRSLFLSSKNNFNYSGTKYMAFISTPIFKNWSIHFLFKYHNLNNSSSNLEILRMGTGLAFNF